MADTTDDPHCNNGGAPAVDGTLAPVDTDPSGVPFSELDPSHLRASRTSVKWTRFDADVLPLFVAEMDFTVAPEIRNALTERVAASDFGYIGEPGPLAPAFAQFALDRWGWQVDERHIHLATDVSCGVVETLRLVLPTRSRVAVTTPVYPSFFEMLEELPTDIVQVPLAIADGEARLDLDALERAFAGGSAPGDPLPVHAIVLCNPHNPHGIVHSRKELTRLAELAARYGVFVVSDEIHAPLTHHGETFTPFAPLAAAAGARSVTVTSASKGWNIAGVKCSIIVAVDERTQALLRALPPEVGFRSSILGLHANTAAFAEAGDWLDRAITQIEANADLLTELAAEKLPGVRLFRPRAGYLYWLDFNDAGLGPDPYGRILQDAKVALGDGVPFGDGGQGHVRVNLACPPDTLREAVDRIASILPAQIATAGPLS